MLLIVIVLVLVLDSLPMVSNNEANGLRVPRLGLRDIAGGLYPGPDIKPETSRPQRAAGN